MENSRPVSETPTPDAAPGPSDAVRVPSSDAPAAHHDGDVTFVHPGEAWKMQPPAAPQPLIPAAPMSYQGTYPNPHPASYPQTYQRPYQQPYVMPGNAAPAWALEPPQPLPYHRLSRLSWKTAQWWRPFATAGVVIALTVFAGIVSVLCWLALAELWPGLPQPTAELTDATNPSDIFIMLGSLAIFVPIAILGSWWGAGRLGSVHSVAGYFRWGLMLRAARVVVPVYAALILLPAILFSTEDMVTPKFSASLVFVYLFIVLLTPLQCAAEEYIFRGLPQQAFGTWLKSPLWGIVIPVPLFMLGHGYDWVGQIDIACFALCMGFLAWKTGGLELPILVHTSNNLMSFLLAPFVPGSLEQGEVDPMSLVFTLPLLFATTAGLWWWVSKRYGLTWKEPLMRQPGAQEGKPGRL